MNPSPSPIEVFVHSGPVEWWQIVAALGPLAILLAAVLAAAISWKTLRQRTTADALALAQKREADADALKQKRLADDRSEWWRRAQWSLDRALDKDEDTKALGLVTLDVLARSELARTEELELFDLAWKAVTQPKGGTPDDSSVLTRTAEDIPLFDAAVGLTPQLDGDNAWHPAGLRFRQRFTRARAWLRDLWAARKPLEDPWEWRPGVDSDDNKGDNGKRTENEEGGQ